MKERCYDDKILCDLGGRFAQVAFSTYHENKSIGCNTTLTREHKRIIVREGKKSERRIDILTRFWCLTYERYLNELQGEKHIY